MSVHLEAKPVHARWSDVNREFLELVERRPEYLRRESFPGLHQNPQLSALPLQPWPFFVDAARWREMETVALGLDGVIKSAIERVLDQPIERIVEFYHSRGNQDGSPALALNPDEDLLTILLEEPNGVRSAPSRADFIETRDGLKCVECNSGSSLGGLHMDDIGRLMLGTAPIEGFLRERGRRARAPRVVRYLFRHVVEDTVRLGAWTGGDFNVAMVVRPNRPMFVASHSAAAYTVELGRALEANGIDADGEVFLCSYAELAEDGAGITLGGRRVHAVIEQHNGEGDIRPVFRAFKRCRVNWFSGPISGIVGDKRNLALVSERADSDDFTAAERSIIERHLPWTRRVTPTSRTTFRGRALRLPDDLPELRAEMVLKKATAAGGDAVVVGRFRTDAEWRSAIARAAWEEDWVVQEYLETVPYCFQSGDAGAPRFEMVWGLFAFGRHFGGAALRMQPAGSPDGVINARRGAEIGAALEVLE